MQGLLFPSDVARVPFQRRKLLKRNANTFLAGIDSQSIAPATEPARDNGISMAPPTPIRRPTRSAEIPDKLYFRIGEVARLCEVPPYVLRFWESEFPQLRPNKGGTGQRLYRKRDVEMALRVKRLLYDEGYTIPGARQVFKSETKEKKDPLLFRAEPEKAVGATELHRLRNSLQEIADLLARPTPGTVGQTNAPRTRTLREVKPVSPKVLPKSEPPQLF